MPRGGASAGWTSRTTTSPPAQWAAIREAWGGCAYCGATGRSLQRDCVLPLSRGGRYTLDNVVPACGSCNASKSNDEVTRWLRRKRLDEASVPARTRVHSSTRARTACLLCPVAGPSRVGPTGTSRRGSRQLRRACGRSSRSRRRAAAPRHPASHSPRAATAWSRPDRPPAPAARPTHASVRRSSPRRNACERTPPVARPLPGNSSNRETLMRPASVPGSTPSAPEIVTATRSSPDDARRRTRPRPWPTG